MFVENQKYERLLSNKDTSYWPLTKGEFLQICSNDELVEKIKKRKRSLNEYQKQKKEHERKKNV